MRMRNRLSIPRIRKTIRFGLSSALMPSIAIVGLLASSSPLAARNWGPVGGGTFIVKAANNTTLGEVVRSDSEGVFVQFRYKGDLLLLRFRGFRNDYPALLSPYFISVYTTTDCSGRPFVATQNVGLMLPYLLSQQDGILYRISDDVEPVERTFASRLNFLTGCQEIPPEAAPGIPMEKALDLNIHAPPPYRVIFRKPPPACP